MNLDCLTSTFAGSKKSQVHNVNASTSATSAKQLNTFCWNGRTRERMAQKENKMAQYEVGIMLGNPTFLIHVAKYIEITTTTECN